MVVSWGHYAKKDNSNRERRELYGITYMWNLKKLKREKPESRMAVTNQGLKGWGNGEILFMDTNLQLVDK